MVRALLMAGVAALGFAGSAQAAFIETALETSIGVVFTGTGSVNVTGLNATGAFNGARVNPAQASLYTGQGYSVFATSGPANFGTGSLSYASSYSGDAFLLRGGSSPSVGVPYNYVSGSALSNTLTFNNATFASLGLTPGIYVYNVNSGVNADTITVQIGPVSSAVPEPMSLALLGAGLVGFGLIRRRRAA